MMQTILLAGGFGSRLSEETSSRPKPMVEIGGQPILSHIMHSYSSHGYNDFLVACGYRAEFIKSYFHSLHIQASDWVIDFRNQTRAPINSETPDWKVTIVDTGLSTMTGGRILRLRDHVHGDTFMATYGDGVGNVDIAELVAFHRQHGKIATVTAVRPPARFGGLAIDGDRVAEFKEKPQTGEGWINGGFFVFNREVFDYLENDETVLELAPLTRLAADGELMAWRHHGFWQPMDTLRDKQMLESLWAKGNAPWKPENASVTRAA